MREYRWPRPRPITNGKHTYTHVDFSMLRIATDEGIEGIGVGYGGPIARATQGHLAPLRSAKTR